MNNSTFFSAQGSVTLVGAGPGDPELLTLKALKAIQRATVLFVDDLVSDGIVAFAQPHARIVRVGKRGGCKSTPQEFIQKLMVMAAREGETVVRLKGGDPFIFGRGGEEVEHLREAGIKVDVINGITAGLAAVTSLGVPLTHRQHAHGVVFVTGHAKPGDAGTDWRALSTAAHSARLTLVIYIAHRPARPHTRRRDPERLAADAAPHHHHAGPHGRHHRPDPHGQPVHHRRRRRDQRHRPGRRTPGCRSQRLKRRCTSSPETSAAQLNSRLSKRRGAAASPRAGSP
jgi:uroporphyrin-III C-methyltransferase